MPLYVRRLTETARLPTRGSEFAAGLDLYADEDALIPPGDRVLISTGIAVALDPGTAGLLWPRSGLAVKYGVGVGAGVIDADFRGCVRVLLMNHGADMLAVSRGDRIAQMLIQQIARPTMTEMDQLPATERGVGGFGSTGCV